MGRADLHNLDNSFVLNLAAHLQKLFENRGALGVLEVVLWIICKALESLKIAQRISLSKALDQFARLFLRPSLLPDLERGGRLAGEKLKELVPQEELFQKCGLKVRELRNLRNVLTGA